MFADTDVIRALGAAHAEHAAELASVAATLSSMPDGTLGPVGARFVAALAEATGEASRSVTTLADRLTAGCHTAHASAAAYESADERAGTQVSGVY
ncbi:Protein of unknown function (DUF2580) [Mycobacterium sp. JS623]|uniref:type VII secretion target n=1 Tax=Mycobacterium sp. JS623 TaxID=212767 RepID=UPI0002A55857|nr:type VII secretion target [Mycobacterium sp. JS623]AGB21694.1 Protein of unknown function (DUF2580) [Mycobacterium sp. JS623]